MDDAGHVTTPRQVAAKTLQTPTTVSPQLARSISMLAAQAAAGGGLPAGWIPPDAAAWKALIAQLDAGTLAARAPMAKMFPHTETVQTIAGVTVREIVPATLDPAKSGKLLLHFHGGGYALNGGEASTGEAVLLAHYSGLRAISVDYRMPPDHPFPAGLDDAVAVYKALTAERSPAAIGVFGTSAGGGMTLALTLKLKALGLPLPGALALGTPWTDLTGASDSYQVTPASTASSPATTAWAWRCRRSMRAAGHSATR
jgi:acetyl esterase/lipase